MTDHLSRRALLSGGAAGATLALSGGKPAAQELAPGVAADVIEPASPDLADGAGQPDALFFFNEPETAFVEAAIDRLIPPDPEWPGAAWAGVLTYIDRQLASAYGAGGRMYLDGPWVPEAPPEQGYQLRFSPAELYRVGIEETRTYVRDQYGGREFWELGEPVRDEVLSALEAAEVPLPSMPSSVFFETLLANTIEGFLADPAYGGNRAMVGWQMVGFPGAYAQYIDLVDEWGFPYSRTPIGMANDAARRAHIEVHR
jgi:gluconate 2-dehydrogenase gamma chain